jgi:phosphoserine phosphatase
MSSRSRRRFPATARRWPSSRRKTFFLAATLTGMPVEEFNTEVTKWIAAAKHPRWDRPYTELTYEPMLEAMRYLRENGYKTYIVTGGGQDFARVYAARV